MHRTYSMRNQRLQTASEMECALPPPSTTKSNRLFTSNFGHAFRKTTAGAFSPSLSKKLSQLVKMEKNVMRSIEQVSRERMEVARQISEWGQACDDDVSDITDKIGVLLYEIAELEDQMVDRYDQYRLTMKSIRNIEKSVQPSRDRKQKITDEIAKLKYKEPNSPKLPVLEQELVRAEAESLVAEAQLSNITREKVKVAFAYHFDSIREQGEKQAIIANYGKHLLELIDDSPVTPGETRTAYDGYESGKAIIQDCEDALTHWTPSTAAVKPALSIRTRALSRRRQRNQEHQIPEDEVDDLHPRLQERPLSFQSSSIVSSPLKSQKSPHTSPNNSRHHQEQQEVDTEDESDVEHAESSRLAASRDYNADKAHDGNTRRHREGHVYSSDSESEEEDEEESEPELETRSPDHTEKTKVSTDQHSAGIAPAAAAAAPALAAV
ncbi:Eisosome core component [Ascosphaera aggregata]|nr:Eisosome core component [Ascosphaera aggregata]